MASLQSPRHSRVILSASSASASSSVGSSEEDFEQVFHPHSSQKNFKSIRNITTTTTSEFKIDSKLKHGNLVESYYDSSLSSKPLAEVKRISLEEHNKSNKRLSGRSTIISSGAENNNDANRQLTSPKMVASSEQFANGASSPFFSQYIIPSTPLLIHGNSDLEPYKKYTSSAKAGDVSPSVPKSDISDFIRPAVTTSNTTTKKFHEHRVNNSISEDEDMYDANGKVYLFRRRKPVNYNQSLLYNTQVLENGLPGSSKHTRKKRKDTQIDFSRFALNDSEDEKSMTSCYSSDSDSALSLQENVTRRGLGLYASGPDQNLAGSGPENDRPKNRCLRRHRPVYYGRRIRSGLRLDTDIPRRRRRKKSKPAKSLHPPTRNKYGIATEELDTTNSSEPEEDTDEDQVNQGSHPSLSSQQNGGGKNTKRSTANEPSAKLDTSSFPFQESFDDIAGLDGHIQSLREMILWPLLYPDEYQRWGIRGPKGVLFYGPPGTGKTMLVKALVNEYSKILNINTDIKHQKQRNVTFYMRSSSEILSKWIGVAEKSLKKLFQDARENAPSVIFFDELDGLAPARTVKQDQSHISLVSTFLTLLDGLTDRGNVIVIGATNRLEAIDPALRRPGRFDRELRFELPNLSTRKDLMGRLISAWFKNSTQILSSSPTEMTTLDQVNPLIDPNFHFALAHLTVGYCGADLKALTTEAVLSHLRRKFTCRSLEANSVNCKQTPILTTANLPFPKQPIDGYISVTIDDFSIALSKVVSTSHREAGITNPGDHLKLNWATSPIQLDSSIACDIRPAICTYIEHLISSL